MLLAVSRVALTQSQKNGPTPNARFRQSSHFCQWRKSYFWLISYICVCQRLKSKMIRNQSQLTSCLCKFFSGQYFFPVMVFRYRCHWKISIPLNPYSQSENINHALISFCFFFFKALFWIPFVPSVKEFHSC